MLTSRWEKLPEDVVEHVFYKLPISSILCARAVCKSWKAKLDSSGFGKCYDLNCGPENVWLVVDGPIVAADVKSAARERRTVISLYNACLDRWFQIPSPWKVCHGAGGLLLLERGGFYSLFGNHVFVVGNPMSKDWKQLPPLTLKGFPNCTCLFKGAGENSYKVVVLVEDWATRVVTPAVYDSEVGIWDVKKSRDTLCKTWLTNPVVCNGVIYAVDKLVQRLLKYNVDNDELTYVDHVARKPHVSCVMGSEPWIMPWKENFYMFAWFRVEQTLKPLGVWVLQRDEWVLLSKSPLHLVRVYQFSPCVWLDGDIVKFFVGGISSLLTYNLAADSWSIVKASCPPPGILWRSVCLLPLHLTAAP